MSDFDWDRAEAELVDVVTLADVGGRSEVKARLRTLRDAGRVLLYGPPGCGKTFLARAVAGELGARFLAVSLADPVDLAAVFERARSLAPAVLLLDEVHAAGRRLPRLLAELDAHRDGFVIGATSAPWQVSPALRSQLNHAMLVPLPDPDAREAILRDHLKDRPIVGIDVGKLAARTIGMTGTDLVNVCESAAERTLRDSAASGTARMIGIRDLNAALADVRPTAPAWFDTARYEAHGWDELATYLRKPLT
jgi:SpoVK/Ycf46/Vps4 family AAA+-type ATPase